MESLVLLVVGLLLTQVFLCSVPLVFAIIWRAKAKFGRTSIVLIALLALETIWAFTNPTPTFGYIAIIFLAASALVRFLPKN